MQLVFSRLVAPLQYFSENVVQTLDKIMYFTSDFRTESSFWRQSGVLLPCYGSEGLQGG